MIEGMDAFMVQHVIMMERLKLQPGPVEELEQEGCGHFQISLGHQGSPVADQRPSQAEERHLVGE